MLACDHTTSSARTRNALPNSSAARIRSTAGNRAPDAAVEATPADGPTPLRVEFSAAGSADADGDELDYEDAWRAARRVGLRRLTVDSFCIGCTASR
mgnify:CR=1 FL=1